MAKNNKIDVCITGFQKSGTTSLLRYLSKHSKVISHKQMEMSFFYDVEEYQKGYEVVFDEYFSDIKNEDQLILAKNAHLATKPKGLQRLYEHNKDCKIIMVLREPVNRAFSAYEMEKRSGDIKGNFDDVVAFAMKNQDHWYNTMILGFGIYSEHITNTLSIFPKENVYFLLFEELKNNTVEEVLKVTEWLNLDPEFSESENKVYNKSGKIRSQYFQKTINLLASEQNPVKRLIRKMLPQGGMASIGIYLRELNQNKSKKTETLSKETRQKLKNYYGKFESELIKLTSLDIRSWK